MPQGLRVRVPPRPPFMMKFKKTFIEQIFPILLTIVVFVVLAGLLWLEIHVLNIFTTTDISLKLRWGDILIGLTVYLKTAIDFAIFIGHLMDKNPGTKGRISIEIGTAVGNAVGTMAILFVWTFFKEVNWLLAIMVFLAGLVLIRLAQDSLEHALERKSDYPRWFELTIDLLNSILRHIDKLTGPVLDRIVPSHKLKVTTQKTFWSLFALSFTVPFILGLDDFAGYVPLFNIVNVFGFGVGVFLGHMILNIALYISPKRTITAVKNPLIAFAGSVAFIILAGWGFIEAFKLLFLHH